MPVLDWQSLIFTLVVPVLAIVMLFALVLYLARGRRKVALNLSALGVTLSINSSSDTKSETDN